MCQDMDTTFYQRQLILQKTSHSLLKEVLPSNYHFTFFNFWSSNYWL